MAKRPAFLFYPAEWKNNAKLRRCSEAARGAWMDILCTLHDSDEYGVIRWSLEDVARSAGVPLKLAKELAQKDVLKGSDGHVEEYVFTPTHSGRRGDPITLIESGDGPCWFSSRMVKDEWIRLRRGTATQFTSENQPPKVTPNLPPKAAPKVEPIPPIGDGRGDGLTSSFASSSSKETTSLRSDELELTPSKAKETATEPNGFSEFYDEYPRKAGRGHALKGYERALKRATARQLLDGARRYAASRRGEDPKFTKHPATWLSSDGWLDDLPPAPTAMVDTAPVRTVPMRQPGESEEHFKVRRFKEIGLWLSTDGAPPGDPDCCMPRAVLIEFEYPDQTMQAAE